MNKHLRNAAALTAALAVTLLTGCGIKAENPLKDVTAPAFTRTASKSGTEAETQPVRKPAPVYGSGYRSDPAGNLSTADAVREMGIGISLGNTFECCGGKLSGSDVRTYETGWGSPRITQQMIEGYAAEGFGTLRIPAAWSNMMLPNNTIHPDYLARVHEVAGWALNAGMYVIINIDRDGGWWSDFADPEKKDACMQKYARIWQQIAQEFAGEGGHVWFESLDSDGCWDEIWQRGRHLAGKEEAYALLGEINQCFVDTVRHAGSGNLRRHLLIAGYADDIAYTCDPLFVMPEDTQNRCAVSVHFETPLAFTQLEADTPQKQARSFWGTSDDRIDMQLRFDLLKDRFTPEGVPVIISNFGCTQMNKELDSVEDYLVSVCTEATERGFCPVLWDAAGGFYDRKKFRLYDRTLQEMLFGDSTETTEESDTRPQVTTARRRPQPVP